jgi:uroporphyrinogen-III synthase
VASGYGSTRGSTSTHGAMSHGLVAAPESGVRSSAPASDATTPPALAGFTVAVATDKRTHDMAGWLDAEGARTIGVRAVRTIPQPDADAIAEAVRTCVAEPVHEVIVSSAFGLRAWLAAARRTGHLDDLLGCFNEARLLARDPATADGLRELGLTQIWSTAAATTEDLFRYLLAQPMTGRRVVAQIETDAQHELCHALRAVGAVVVEVATSQFAAPTHMDVVRRLNDLVTRRHVDAVVLAGGVVAQNLVDQAIADACLDDVLNAFVGDVMAVCLGPLTAAPLIARGVPVVRAAEPVPRSLAALVLSELPKRAIVVEVAGRRIEVRGQAVVIAGQLVAVQAGPLAVLRALASRPGRVLSAAEIRAVIPHSSPVDDHAVEMAVSRLRGSLDGNLAGLELVQTVMKRGYRLAV